MPKKPPARKPSNLPCLCVDSRGYTYAYFNREMRRFGHESDPKCQERFDRLLQQWLANGRILPKEAQPDARLTMDSLFALWLEDAPERFPKRRDGRSDLDDYLLILRYIRPVCGLIYADDFSPKILRKCRDFFVSKKLVRRKINVMVSRICRIVQWGVSEELIPSNVWHACKSLEPLKPQAGVKESKKVLPVPVEVVEATLPAMPPVVAALLRFMLCTGCRPGEAALLRACDIDRSNPDCWVFRPEFHKTKRRGIDRRIFIGPKAQAVILPYLERADDQYCFSPAESMALRSKALREARKSPMTPSQRKRSALAKKKPRCRPPGQYYRPSAINHSIASAVRRINQKRTQAAAISGEKAVLLPRWHTHQLRHTAGTIFRKLYGVERTQVLLGHENVSTTEIYAEADMSQAMRDAAHSG